MQNLQMMIQGSGNKCSEGSGSSKGERKDMSTDGVSGDGHIVCWNKFLPFRSLKVLVVENDDSTRHVVSALLKKCGYEVIAVANGLQAWKVLEDQNNHVDIVLTEVVLPFLTGLGLLRKITSHETRKNLPVIMMSPSDSLGIVFTCLSKGATDFLVKPIRKNELRTLWQHVWRKRHCSSGGSVAESEAVTRSNALVKSPGTGKSGSSSNNGNDIETHGLDNRNGSDQGSGTQQEPKDNRKGKIEPPAGHLSDPPMHNWDLNHSAGEPEGHNKGDKTVGRDVSTRIPGNSTSKVRPSSEKVPEQKTSEKSVQEYTSKDNGHSGNGSFEKALGKEMGNGDAHLAAAVTKNGEAHLGARSEVCVLPGLKQSEGGKGNGGKATRQRNVLGHSSHSAFSRYGTALNATPKVQSGNEGSCSPLEDVSGANEEPFTKYQGNSAGTTTNPQSVMEPQVCKYKQRVDETVKSPHPNSVQQMNITYASRETGRKTNGSSGDTTLDQFEINNNINLQHHYHPYYHHHYHVQNLQQLPNGSKHGDTTMNDVPFMDKQLQPPFSGHNGGYSAHMFSVNQMEGAGAVYGFMNGMASNHQLQRMAAIHKFRQKRNVRHFNKKVRYESRKILADQRPRMKGQFVRRTDINNNNGDHLC